MIDFITSVFDLLFSLADFLLHYDYSRPIPLLKAIAVYISIPLVLGIIYSVYKSNQIFVAMHVFDEPKGAPPEKNKNQEDWDKILAGGKSENENDRKQAVIGADSLIDKILGMAGYSGENLGEKLKNIEPADLDSLDALWEAHKVRNRIAHEADYALPKEDSGKALSLFEKALKELEYI
ncbi:MAG: hypothetical protein Q8Q46_01200 [Candidatus Giovannonibacteria bacterium]|nr:hypothetical protein [Candidatus Giovannonibacteria bacterium]